MNTVTERLLANPVPKALRIASGERPPSRPVTMPATVTTRSGFIRSANPMTTSRTPIRTSMPDLFSVHDETGEA